ncbi:uncharacterized protein TNCT_273421, partial [Trichonephila clavata]
ERVLTNVYRLYACRSFSGIRTPTYDLKKLGHEYVNMTANVLWPPQSVYIITELNMPRTKRKNKSSKLSIQKRWCTETKTESNMDISEHNSNVAQRSSGDRILKNERISMQEKSVLEQENIADTYDGPSYIIVDKNALCDIFKYTLCGICNQSTLKLEFGHKYGFSHQLKLVCKTCSEQKMECFTSPRLEKKSNTSTPFDVNVRAVQAFLAISGGHASVEKFCMFLNMPLMS